MASWGNIAAADEKRKRSAFRTRATMNFDPALTILHSQEEAIEYLKRHYDAVHPGIKVEWCRLGKDFKVPPPMTVCIFTIRL